MSNIHVDSSFHKQSMKIDNYVKIKEWIDFSVGQSTVIQTLDKERYQSKVASRREFSCSGTKMTTWQIGPRFFS